jgi:hypothetical protein
MLNQKALSELRDAINRINREVMRESETGEATNKEVLDRVKKLHENEISALTPDLIHIALTKLYNEVGNRKGPKPFNNQGVDLFGIYHGIPQTVTTSPGVKRATTKLTFVEADRWLNSQKPRPEVKRNEALSRMVEDCRPYMVSPDDTLEAAMERRRDALEAKAQSRPMLDSK